MAKQPQVVTAVIRPCKSPPPQRETKKPLRPSVLLKKVRTKSQNASEPSSSAPLAGKPPNTSNGPPKHGFLRATNATKAKSKSTLPVPKSTTNGPHVCKGAVPKSNVPKLGTPRTAPNGGILNKQSLKNSDRNHAASHAGSKGGRKSSASSVAACRRGGSAASDPSGSLQRASPQSSRSTASRKPGSLSSRPPMTSSQGQRSSGISPVSSKTRYPKTTSATSEATRRSAVRSPPSSSNGPKRRGGAEPYRPNRSPSQEARINKLKNQLDHLKNASPVFASPEFTSTRTNLASPRSVGSNRSDRSPRSDTSARRTKRNRSPGSPGRHSVRSSALFHVQEPRKSSRSRSTTPVRSHSCAAGVTWVETHNRADKLGCGSAADMGVSGQPRRDLPRVTYPTRVRSSTSQTRHRPSCVTPRVERVCSRATLHSRGAAGARQKRGCVSTPAASRSGVERRSVHGRAAGMATACPRPGKSPRGAGRSDSCAAPRRPAARSASDGAQCERRPGTPPSPVRKQLASIDYSPQSKYISRLLRRGAVERSQRRAAEESVNSSLLRRTAGNRRPGKENRRPGSGSPRDRSSSRETGGGRASVASRGSVASEPTGLGRAPSRKSILRTSAASNQASSEPAPPHYGYEWISSMLDLGAPLPKSRKDVEAARRFREKNFGETHARHNWKDTARQLGKKKQNHKCVHEYYINQRLFPEPLYTDAEGRSQCPVCLAVGPQPASTPHRRSRSRSRSPASDRGRSRSPVSSQTRGRPRSLSRSPAPGRASRPRTRSVTGAAGSGRRGPSPRRKQSSVSWHDEVVRAPMTGRARRSRTPSPRGSRRGGATVPSAGRSKRRSSSRSRSPTPSRRPSCERSIVCPNCSEHVTVHRDGSATLSDSDASPHTSRRSPQKRAPRQRPQAAPAAASPQWQRAAAAASGRAGAASGPSGRTSRGKRSAITLRSRPPSSEQPVKAMFTVPMTLFSEGGGTFSQPVALAREAGGRAAAVQTRSVTLGPSGYDWDAASFTGRDPLDPRDWPGQPPDQSQPRHPLWPRQLDLPTGIRPIARGWPALADDGDLSRTTSRLKNASLVPGVDPGSRRSIQNTAAPAAAKNTFSLRRVIGEKM